MGRDWAPFQANELNPNLHPYQGRKLKKSHEWYLGTVFKFAGTSCWESWTSWLFKAHSPCKMVRNSEDLYGVLNLPSIPPGFWALNIPSTLLLKVPKLPGGEWLFGKFTTHFRNNFAKAPHPKKKHRVPFFSWSLISLFLPQQKEHYEFALQISSSWSLMGWPLLVTARNSAWSGWRKAREAW